VSARGKCLPGRAMIEAREQAKSYNGSSNGIDNRRRSLKGEQELLE